jgi:hypothetical protein
MLDHAANAPNASVYLVGKDSRGHWVVRDQGGLRGGLFVTAPKR